MDELQLLTDMFDEEADPAQAVKDRARQELLRAGEENLGGRVHSRTLVSGMSRRVWLTAGVSVLIVALVLGLGPLRGPGAPDPAAAQALREVAAVAETGGLSSMEAGQFRYTKSESAYLSTHVVESGQAFSVLVPAVREIWIAADGSGRISEVVNEPVFLGDQDRQKWEAAGRPPLGGQGGSTDFGLGGLHYVDLDSLPTDPDALATVIRQRAEDTDVPTHVEMLVIVGDLLRETVAHAELRAALYRVAADLPGIEYVGETTDRAGRVGIGVAMTSGYSGAEERHMLIFDPITSDLLGEEYLLLERVDYLDAEPPAVTGWAAYLESGLVANLP